MYTGDFYPAVLEYRKLKNVTLSEAVEILKWFEAKFPNNLKYRNNKNIGFSFSSWRIFLKFGKDMPVYGSKEWSKESNTIYGY